MSESANPLRPEEVIGREYGPSLLPLYDLRLLDDGEKWESTGIDPQFDVVGPWQKGWTKISLEIETEEGVIGSSRLYVDSGEGYSEEESHDLGAVNQEQVSYLPLGPEVIRLRLDPFGAKGEFRVKKLIFQRVSSREGTKGAQENRNRNALNREVLASIYLRGNGIEIGALNNPLKVPSDVKVQYVDCKIPEELQKFYVSQEGIKAPDILMDGEKLTGIKDESQDFVIANHFIEHCEDPIGTIENFLRVVKRHGILFLTLPDKRFTFDVCRPLTTFEHLLRDYREGGEWSRFGHHEEGHRLILGITDEKQIRRNIEEMGDTHYHVWTQIEMLEMVVRLRRELAFDFELEVFLNHPPHEAILIIRKGAAKMSEQEELAWFKGEREAYRKRYPDFEF
ncbi:MAG TPA: methyltransferase domain-containing protein [Pyrinomonadaceae bacterium]|nr:methyltransferase domain-containing protein [Pyrinomonadaceae bacterium]